VSIPNKRGAGELRECHGREIYELSEEIRQSVLDRFGVELHREVNVIE
jgi:UDP-N-acetylenolpyruvoylglucosamine reductase